MAQSHQSGRGVFRASVAAPSGCSQVGQRARWCRGLEMVQRRSGRCHAGGARQEQPGTRVRSTSPRASPASSRSLAPRSCRDRTSRRPARGSCRGGSRIPKAYEHLAVPFGEDPRVAIGPHQAGLPRAASGVDPLHLPELPLRVERPVGPRPCVPRRRGIIRSKVILDEDALALGGLLRKDPVPLERRRKALPSSFRLWKVNSHVPMRKSKSVGPLRPFRVSETGKLAPNVSGRGMARGDERAFWACSEAPVAMTTATT